MRSRFTVATIFGMLLAVLIGAWGQYLFRYIQPLRGLTSTHMPILVFAGLVICVGAVSLLNPLLARISSRLRIGSAGLALVFALTLVACFVPAGGLIRYFPRSLVQPLANMRAHPSWRNMKLLEYTPPILLANDGQDTKAVVSDYLSAAGARETIGIRDVPWHAWWRPLGVWSAIIALVMLGVISLAVLVHHQWATKERIRYPIAEVASSLLKQDDKGRAVILSDKLFWIGLAIPFAIRVVNALPQWISSFKNLQPIQLSLDFSAIGVKFPELARTPGAGNLLRPEIVPACIGLTFLLASDIGFSLGITNLLSVAVMYAMITLGLHTSDGNLLGGHMAWQNYGSCLAMAATLIYVGRQYYWHTLKQAVTCQPQQDTTPSGVWACRTFLLSALGTCAILISVGLDWPLAIFAVFSVILLFMVCARMNTECGAYYYAPSWMISGILVGLIGLPTLGPRMLVIVALFSYVLALDPFDCLMPSVANGLRITTEAGHSVGKMGAVLAVCVVVVLAVTIPAALWTDYNFAADMRHGSDTSSVYAAAERSVTELSLSGELEKTNGYGAWQRLTNMRPDSMCLTAIAIGFGCFVLCSWLRLRFAWWPLHPVILIGFGSWPIARFSASFLLGWLVKSAVMRFGGPAKYLRLKPMMIGVVAGDMAGRLIAALSSWLNAIVTK